MLVTPALPWPTGDTGGTIKLSRRVTEQELIDGILKITLDNAGREYDARIVRYQDNTLRVVADNDVFNIDPIPQSSDTLTLTRIAGEAAQAYSVINVELKPIPEIVSITPDTPWDFSSQGTLELNTDVDQNFILSKLMCTIVNVQSGSVSNIRFAYNVETLNVMMGQHWVAKMDSFEGTKSTFQITTNAQGTVDFKVNGFILT